MDKRIKKIINDHIAKAKETGKKTLLISHLHLSAGGGAEISLVNLVEEMHDDFDITLLLFHKRKDAIDNIRRILSKCRVIYAEDALKRSLEENEQYREILNDSSEGRMVEKTFVQDVIRRGKKRLFGDYVFDYGIEYFGAYPINGMLLRESCRVAAVFQHTDIYMNFSNHQSEVGKNLPSFPALNRYYDKFDKVVAVGDGIRDINARKLQYPKSLLNKAATATNFIDYKKVLEGASAPLPSGIIIEDTVNFCYFGRLAAEKNIENLIRAFSIFVGNVENSGRYRLFLIGRDEMSGNLQELAHECGVEGKVVFAGNHENPFPIVTRMHLFVLPSFFESFSLSLHEARILGIPALMANFETAESLRESQDIITGHSAEELADGMRQFADSESMDEWAEDCATLIGEAHNRKSKHELLKVFGIDEGETPEDYYTFDKSRWGGQKWIR